MLESIEQMKRAVTRLGEAVEQLEAGDAATRPELHLVSDRSEAAISTPQSG
jgi:hypothetical protein